MRRCEAEDGCMNANSDKDYIDAKVETMHTLLDERLGAFQAMMDGRFAEMRAYMDGRFAAMDAKIDRVVAELRAEMAQNTAQIIKWMIGIWIASGVLFISVMTFVVNNAASEARAANATVLAEVRAARAVAPAAQPPIIIQLPPAAAPPQKP
jgi:hypothetical protein